MHNKIDEEIGDTVRETQREMARLRNDSGLNKHTQNVSVICCGMVLEHVFYPRPLDYYSRNN